MIFLLLLFGLFLVLFLKNLTMILFFFVFVFHVRVELRGFIECIEGIGGEEEQFKSQKKSKLFLSQALFIYIISYRHNSHKNIFYTLVLRQLER